MNKGKMLNIKWFPPILIILCCFVLYGNSIKNNYSLDDSLVITNNSNVLKGIFGIPAILKSKTFKDEKSSYAYRPVPLISFAIEYQLFKANPQVSHFISVLLYCIVCILFFITLKLLFPLHFSFTFLAVLFFLFHPLHTEVVNNIKCRDELLMMMFSLSAFFFYIKYYLIGKLKYFIYAVLLMFAAFFCKHSAIAFSLIIPLALCFVDLKPKVKRVLPVFFSIAVLFCLFIIMRKSFTAADHQIRTLNYFENPLYFKEFIDRIPVIFYSFVYYIKLLIFPSNLSFYYGFDYVSIPSWKSSLPIAGLISTAGLIFLSYYFFRKQKLISLGILLFGIGIGPFLNIIPVPGIIAERFAFISSLGWSVAISGLFFFMFKLDVNKFPPLKAHPLFYSITFLILLLYSGRILTRNFDWKDQLTLFTADIQHLDRSAKAHSMLAGELISSAEKETDPNKKNNLLIRALRHYEKCVEIFPAYSSAWNNMGTICFTNFGKFDVASQYFEKALKYDSLFSKASFNLAFSYEKLRRNEQALNYYSNTIKIDPEFIEAYRKMSKIHFNRGNIEEALSVTKSAISNVPSSPALHVDAANYSIIAGDTLSAILHFEAAFESEKDLAKKKGLGRHLFQLFQKTGNSEKTDIYSEFI